MKLVVSSNHPVLPAQEIDDLPEFVLISGLNGSGKSQLIDAIMTKRATLHASNDADPYSILMSANFNQFLTTSNRTVELRAVIVDQTRDFIEFLQKNPQQVSRLRSVNDHLEETFQSGYRIARQMVFDCKNDMEHVALLDVEAEVDKFLALPKQLNTVAGIKFSDISKKYLIKKSTNDFRLYCKEKGKSGIPNPLTEEQFLNHFGAPPWEILNDELTAWGFDFKAVEPEIGDEMKIARELSFISKSTKKPVPSGGFSSGEKTIFGLLGEYYQQSFQGRKPQVLLLDEIDALLNPSLAAKLIKMLKNVFVDKLGVKVVFTTHSPATLACAPDDSHFVMDLHKKKLIRSSREDAIARLFAGTPELFLITEKTRQVFCESGHDARDFNLLFRICRQNPDVKMGSGQLNFVCFGKKKENQGEANRTQVEELVKLLGGNDNPLVRGIVDGDRDNKISKPGVVFVASGKRYSRENLILDPLVLGLYLLKLRLDSNDHFEGLSELKYVQFREWSKENRQKLIDIMCKVVKKQFEEGADLSDDSVCVGYSDGGESNVAKWWLSTNGHDLEEMICKAFPKLKNPNHEFLTLKVIEHVVEEFDIVPKELIDTFRELLK